MRGGGKKNKGKVEEGSPSNKARKRSFHRSWEKKITSAQTLEKRRGREKKKKREPAYRVHRAKKKRV